ncbi:MAG TPA: protease pro-enzyme activation domain-containing protein [Verrucomicrobiae bacterium]|jgi:subtilase family serine protease|nr:protease pro-enzyme activation domain-containing protein [Verrucomicrobiae bacterium]
MRASRFSNLVISVAILCLLSAPLAFAAAASDGGCTPMAVSRLNATIDETALVPLPGNLHPMARAEFDQGKVSDDLRLEHMILLLKRTPEQESALQARIDQMHNRQSPLFHQWLDADQVGSCYGVSDADIAVVSGWLQKHGFTVDSVSAGRMMLIFTGTAGQITEAFHTEIHHLNVHGEKHIANMSTPQVPAALAPVIAGFRSLHDFLPKPMMHMVGAAKRDAKTGKLQMIKSNDKLLSVGRVISGNKPNSLVTYNDNPYCAPGDCEWLGPQDFYTIYNEKPLLTGTICGGPCNGAGQTVAVLEETDVCEGQSGTTPDDCAGANDLAMFRSQFGLPPAHAKYYFGISGYCADPGVQGPYGTGEESEADIDLQWTGTTAPGATVDYLACATTATTAGVDLAGIYAVDRLYKSISSFSLSYGVCELGLTEGEYGGLYQTNAFYNSLWQQAVAEGQTVNVSAGDSGDDTCERGREVATIGWNVNGMASTPYDVAAGGTDFSDNYSSGFALPPNAYWNTNDSAPYGSALSYIPEVTWNQTCGSALLTSFLNFELDSSFTQEQLCSGDTPYGFDFTYVDGSGGGGISSIYSLPTWQSVYGVGRNSTSGTMRNLPDVSLFASANFWSHALQFCESDALTGTGGGLPCDYSNADEGGILAAGGTSFVAPQINGIIGVINQTWRSRQGQANYHFYALANHEYGSINRANTSTSEPSVFTCESNYIAIIAFGHAAANCIFHDIYRTPAIATGTCVGSNNTNCVVDGNVMPCLTGTTDCFTSNSADEVGLLSLSTSSFEPAWYQSAGYNDAVGLGSLNINNLVRDWVTLIPGFPSTTSVSSTTSAGAKSATITAVVTATGRGSIAPPMGTVDFYTSAPASSASLDCGNAAHLTRLSTVPLIAAADCTTSCHATAVLSGLTAAQFGGSGSHDVIACFSGDAANDAPSFDSTTVDIDHP